VDACGDLALRLLGTCPAGELHPLPRFEILVVLEEVRDLRELDVGQVAGFVDRAVHRRQLVGRDGEDLRVASRLVVHAQHADRTATDDDAGDERHRREHEDVAGITVVGKGLRDVAVITRIMHRRRHEAVDEHGAGFLVHFVLDRLAVHRDLDDDVAVVGDVVTGGNAIEAHSDVVERSGKTTPRAGAQLYRRALHAAAILGAVAYLGTGPARADAPAAQPTAFSSLHPGPSFAPWTPIAIAFGKHHTRYDLVDDAGTTVLHAIADDSASALACPMRLAPRDAPTIAWRWKIARLIADADSREASREDAPARIVLEFDGDTRKLPLLERGVYAVAKRVAGRELPY